jgi:hypothetical protein
MITDRELLQLALHALEQVDSDVSSREPLTDEQLVAIQKPYLKRGKAGHIAFARAIERAHGIGEVK